MDGEKEGRKEHVEEKEGEKTRTQRERRKKRRKEGEKRKEEVEESDRPFRSFGAPRSDHMILYVLQEKNPSRRSF